MTKKSNLNGRAFEYIFASLLTEKLNIISKAELVKNKRLSYNQNHWQMLTNKEQKEFKSASEVAINKLIELNGLSELYDQFYKIEIQDDIAVGLTEIISHYEREIFYETIY